MRTAKGGRMSSYEACPTCHYSVDQHCKEKDAEIEGLKALLTRAADALDNPRGGSEALDEDFDLIILLRKAAQ